MTQRKDQSLTPWTPRNPYDPYGRALQPYTNGNGNGYAPYGQAPNQPAPPPGHKPAPSMIESLIKLFFARWWVLILIAMLGAVGSYFTIQKYGKQSFSVEGVLTYTVPDDFLQRKIFSPLKIETIKLMVKSPEVIEQAVKDSTSPLTPDAVARQLRVLNVEMSDNLSVTLDTAEKESSGALVNRIMELTQKKYLKERNQTFGQALDRTEQELKNAQQSHNDNMTKFRDELERLKVGDPRLEYETTAKQVADLTDKVNELENSEQTLKDQIAAIKQQLADQVKPVDPKTPDNEHLTQDQKANLIKTEGDLKKAQKRLEAFQNDYPRIRRQASERLIPLDELRKLEQGIFEAEKDVETLKAMIAALEKKPDPKNIAVPAVAIDPLVDIKKELIGLEKDLRTLPSRLNFARVTLKEKQKQLTSLSTARKLIEPFEQAINRSGTVLADRQKEHSELLQFRSKINDPSTSELKIRSLANGNPSAVSSNHMKIAAAVFGLLFLLYGAYLAAFELPRVAASQSPPPAAPQAPANGYHPGYPPPYPMPYYGPPLPVPVLGHFAPMTMPTGRYLASPPPQSPEVHTLADGIADKFREPGSIVLFTPMGEGVQVEKLVSELSRHYADKGESVLLFDARGVSTPLSMAMTGNRQGAIDNYLDGNSEDAGSCFTPTQFKSVEYTRGDISHTATGGAMAMYRFRQLLDEMRNRYSKVLMIGPTARHVDDLEMLTAFSEGVVLVVQDQANPNDVNAYVEAMKNADAPIFGAVVVGNPMR